FSSMGFGVSSGVGVSAGFSSMGAGVLSGPRTPAYRALLSAGWQIGTGSVEEKALPELPLDSDFDEIPDSADKCPKVPEDFDGFEDGDGCPELDNDGDGLNDDVDKCPNEPETKNGVKDDDGCPDQKLVVLDLAGGQIHVLVDASLLFGFGRAHVAPTEAAILKQIAYVLKTNPEIDLLRVDGHSSWTGSAAYNRRLSLQRARSVVAVLVRLGVPPRKLKAKGWGFSRLKIKRKGPAFNKVNRRVEFVIVTSGPSKTGQDDEFEPEEGDSSTIPDKKPEPVKESPAPVETPKPIEEKPAEAPTPLETPKPIEEKPAETPTPVETPKPIEEKPAETPTPLETPKPIEEKPAETPTPLETPKPIEEKPAETPTPLETPKPIEEKPAETPTPTKKTDSNKPVPEKPAKESQEETSTDD
ncbi:MAG TPA: hypothetical protein EYN66_17150, partial [Myxococcales bacterium]|nr:hypothetical protein [Myxococcales bacterium]